MIAELTGVITRTDAGRIVLNVGGVGYGVAVLSPDSFLVGQDVHLFTHFTVRETAQELYGFLEKGELDVFELLLKVPNVGPKSALQILSRADIGLLKKAAAADDPVYLSKMSGIGKKSAEKIVVGLKDALEHIEPGIDDTQPAHQDGDVIEALISLGYSQKDAREALKALPEELEDTAARVKAALGHLGS